MNSTVIYTLDKCVKCMKCLKHCPTNAITMNNDRIKIDDEKCINCGKCIKACHSQGIQAKGSTLTDLKNYDFTICLVPSSLICDCKSQEDVESLFYAIKQLGFDEVKDITDIEAQVAQNAYQAASTSIQKENISSFCPVINELISVKYPMLLNNLTLIDYPSEIAARVLRQQYQDKGRIGIFNCCECEAKLALAKYPYGNQNYEVDHALSIVDILPLIRENLHHDHLSVNLCGDGLRTCAPSNRLRKDNELIADGFDKVINILDMVEFGLLNEYDLITLYPCFNGCLGGRLLWGNSYLTQNNLKALIPNATKKASNLNEDMLYTNEFTDSVKDFHSFQEKMRRFNSINEQLDKLPGLDCTACGLPSCRIMAEEIVKGNKKIDDCVIHRNRGSNHED